jgi:acyl-CoA thioesterase
MKIDERMRNPIGSVHGGVLYTCADVVGGSAAASYGTKITTLDSSMQYLRPGLQECTELIGVGKVIKRGKRVIVSQVEIRSQTGTVLSTGTFTYMVLQ